MPAIQRTLLAMMDHAYVIRRWSTHFETPESLRRGGPMTWVAMPNKHDGAGFARAAKVKNPVAAFCGWYFAIQVASKMPVRGLLADLDGPLDAESLALKTRIPKTSFMTALSVFADPKIGWLLTVPWDQNLDFWHNVKQLQATADLCAHVHTPDDARARRRTSPPRKKEGAPHGDVHTSAHSSPTDAHSPAVVRTTAQPSAKTQLQDSTEQDITIPLPSPEGGLGELNFDAAKALLNEVFGREKRNWSREEDGLLADVVPIRAVDAVLIRAWFRLPEDHPVFERTKRKQELTTFLRDFHGENDKMRRFAPLFISMNGKNGAKKEPPLWRQTLRWVHSNEDLRLPAGFDELPADLKKEYAANYEQFAASDQAKDLQGSTS